jgi:PAS domain S-box-containing protein
VKKSRRSVGRPVGADQQADESPDRLRARIEELERRNESLQFTAAQVDLVREQFSDLYDYAPVGYVTVDARSVIHRVNLPAAALLGSSRQELVGARLLSFIRPGEKTACAAFLKTAFAAPGPTTFEVRLVAGKWRAEHVQLITAPASGGRDLGHAGAQVRIALVDVSERKRADEALRESERRFEAVVSAMAEGVVTHDASGAIVTSNTSAERILGLSADEIRGRKSVDPRWRAIHEDGSPFPGSEHPTMVVLRTGVPQWGVIMGIHRVDGSLAWIRVNAEPLRNADGSVQGAVATFADVTEERRKAAEVQASEARLSRVLEGSADGFWEIDVQSRHVSVSERYLEIFGLPRGTSDLALDEIQRPILPDDLPAILTDIAAMSAGTKNTFSWEFRVRRPDGEVRWILSRGKVLARVPGGRPKTISGMTTDITARKEAEASLATREALLRAVAHSVPAGAVVVVDGSLRCVFADGSRSFRGIDPSWYQGRALADSFPPDMAAPIERLVRRALAGETVSHDLPIGDRIVALRAGPVSGQGELAGLCSIISQDVTEERRTTEALRVSEERLRDVLDASSDGFWERDLVTGTVFHSARMSQIVGRPPVDAVVDGGAWLRNLHPDDQLELRPAYERVLAGKVERFDRTFRAQHADGSWRWIRGRGKVTARDGAGRPTRLAGTITDIHDGMMARKALEESEARFRALATSAPVGIFQTDASGGNVFLNPAAEKMMGLPASDARGSGWAAAVHPEDRERVYREWTEAASTGRDFTSEYRFLSRAGTTTWVRGFGAAIADLAGNVTGYVGVVVDLTEQRELQRQIALSSRLAAMGTLVAGVGHEINNPLAAVMAGHGLTREVLRDTRRKLHERSVLDPDAEVRQLDDAMAAMEDAWDGTQRIAAIVKDLAAIARPDPKRAPVRLGDVAGQAIRWIGPFLDERATVDVQDLGAPDVLASSGQLEQVVVNLLTNAAQATRQGTRGDIVVRLLPGDSGTGCLEVVDHGVGIDPTILDRVFEPFFGTRQVGEGRRAGLGLAICHAIVTAHGGTIAATSTPGAGSTFRVELPAAPPERGTKKE